MPPKLTIAERRQVVVTAPTTNVVPRPSIKTSSSSSSSAGGGGFVIADSPGDNDGSSITSPTLSRAKAAALVALATSSGAGGAVSPSASSDGGRNLNTSFGHGGAGGHGPSSSPSSKQQPATSNNNSGYSVKFVPGSSSSNASKADAAASSSVIQFRDEVASPLVPVRRSKQQLANSSFGNSSSGGVISPRSSGVAQQGATTTPPLSSPSPSATSIDGQQQQQQQQRHDDGDGGVVVRRQIHHTGGTTTTTISPSKGVKWGGNPPSGKTTLRANASHGQQKQAPSEPPFVSTTTTQGEATMGTSSIFTSPPSKGGGGLNTSTITSNNMSHNSGSGVGGSSTILRGSLRPAGGGGGSAGGFPSFGGPRSSLRGNPLLRKGSRAAGPLSISDFELGVELLVRQSKRILQENAVPNNGSASKIQDAVSERQAARVQREKEERAIIAEALSMNPQVFTTTGGGEGPPSVLNSTAAFVTSSNDKQQQQQLTLSQQPPSAASRPAGAVGGGGGGGSRPGSAQLHPKPSMLLADQLKQIDRRPGGPQMMANKPGGQVRSSNSNNTNPITTTTAATTFMPRSQSTDYLSLSGSAQFQNPSTTTTTTTNMPVQLPDFLAYKKKGGVATRNGSKDNKEEGEGGSSSDHQSPLRTDCRNKNGRVKLKTSNPNSSSSDDEAAGVGRSGSGSGSGSSSTHDPFDKQWGKMFIDHSSDGDGGTHFDLAGAVGGNEDEERGGAAALARVLSAFHSDSVFSTDEDYAYYKFYKERGKHMVTGGLNPTRLLMEKSLGPSSGDYTIPYSRGAGGPGGGGGGRDRNDPLSMSTLVTMQHHATAQETAFQLNVARHRKSVFTRRKMKAIAEDAQKTFRRLCKAFTDTLDVGVIRVARVIELSNESIRSFGQQVCEATGEPPRKDVDCHAFVAVNAMREAISGISRNRFHLADLVAPELLADEHRRRALEFQLRRGFSYRGIPFGGFCPCALTFSPYKELVRSVMEESGGGSGTAVKKSKMAPPTRTKCCLVGTIEKLEPLKLSHIQQDRPCNFETRTTLTSRRAFQQWRRQELRKNLAKEKERRPRYVRPEFFNAADYEDDSDDDEDGGEEPKRNSPSESRHSSPNRGGGDDRGSGLLLSPEEQEAEEELLRAMSEHNSPEGSLKREATTVQEECDAYVKSFLATPKPKHQLSESLLEAIEKKKQSDMTPLRKHPPMQQSKFDEFAQYKECVFKPEYLVVYEVANVDAINDRHRRSNQDSWNDTSATAASKKREHFSAIEFTTRWTVPISELKHHVSGDCWVKHWLHFPAQVLHSPHVLSLADVMNICGHGSLSIDVCDVKGEPVYRHSCTFTDSYEVDDTALPGGVPRPAAPESKSNATTTTRGSSPARNKKRPTSAVNKKKGANESKENNDDDDDADDGNGEAAEPSPTSAGKQNNNNKKSPSRKGTNTNVAGRSSPNSSSRHRTPSPEKKKR